MNVQDYRAATRSSQFRQPCAGRWQSIPLPVRMMFVVAGALFAMALTMHSVQAQSISSTVCQPTALPLSGAESRAVNSEPTLNNDGTRAAFWSTANPLDLNADQSIEIFWANTTALTDTAESPIRQATVSRGNILGGFNIMPDMMTYITSGNVQRSFVVFASDRDFELQNGASESLNKDGGFEIFLAQMEPEQRIWQLTNTSRSASMMPTVSAIIGGRYLRIAYLSDADNVEARPKANNPDRNYEVHTMRVDLLPLDRATPGRPTVDQEFQLTNTSLDTVNDQPVISANGNKVVWLSNASSGINVVNTLNNPDRNREVFVTTVANPTVGVQVTKSTRGDNDQPDINEDGTRITFASTVSNYPANGVFGTSNLGPQSIYIARLTPAMQASSVTGLSRISASVRAPTGRTVNAKEPAISADGRRVVFAADGCDPAPSSGACNQPAGIYQVFVVDQQLSAPTQFSIARVTNAITRTHELPAVSGDGQRIALVTTQDAGIDNPDLSGSEILALECRVARLGATLSINTISPSVLDNRPDVGDEIALRISLENTTFADFTGVMVMTDTLPLGVTYLTASIVSEPPGSTIALNPESYNPATRRLLWSVTNLPKLTEAVIEIRARVNPNQGGFTLTNLVTLGTAADLELQGISNFDEEESLNFRVTQVDLRSSLAVNTQIPREGQVYTYTVTVENPQTVPPGNTGRAETMDPATNVVVTTTLAALLNQMDFVRVATTGVDNAATFNTTSGVIGIPRINGGQTAVVSIAMRPRAGAGGQAQRTATISGIRSDQEDIAIANNIGTPSQTIRVLGTDLATVGFSANQPIPPQNSSVTFRLEMRNRGPLPNTPNPPTDGVYTANAAAFVPAMVMAHATIPTGINVTAVSDGGIALPTAGGTSVSWQVPGWSTAITRTVYITGMVVAEPGTDLTATGGDLSAFFAPPGSESMNDPVIGNNGLLTETIRVNSRATIGTPSPERTDEGGLIVMPVTYGDLDLEDTHFITVTWGDGSPASTTGGFITRLPCGTNPPPCGVNGVYTFTHVYADDPAGVGISTYPINITLVDSTGNLQTAQAIETVDNVAPAVTLTGMNGFVLERPGEPPVHVALAAQPIQVSLAFTDPGYTTAWSSETFRYLLRSIGPDVTGDISTVTNGSPGTPTAGTVTIGNTYPTAGNGIDSFPMQISVLDDDMNDRPDPITLRFMVDARPIAVDDEYTMDEGQQILAEALSNGVDTDNGPTLEVTRLITTTTVGEVTNFNSLSGTFNYTATIPNLSSGQVYRDSVGYEIVDSVGLTATATVYFNVTGVNDVPVVDLNGAETTGIDNTAAFVEDAPAPTILAPDGDLFDNDGNDEIQSLVVTLVNPQDGALEVLTATVTSTILLNWNAGTHELTFLKANPAVTPDWDAALRTVRYLNSSPDPDETPRTVIYVAADQDGPSQTATTALSVTSVDDAPIITLNAAALAVNEGTGAIVDSGATVADEDTATWGGGSLTASVVGATALDYLRVAPGGDITVESDVSIRHGITEVATYTGFGTAQIVITFLPEATTEIVQAIVRQIEYLRGSGVAEGNRTISMVANSVVGGPVSNAATRALTIAYTNDPPAIGMTPPTVTEDTPQNIRANISVSDSDAGTGNLRMTIAVDQGTLLVAGVGVPVVPATAAATVVFTGTIAQLNSGTITYAPPLNYDGIVNLSVAVNDLGNTGGDPETASVSLPFDIIDVNDAPVVDLNGPGANGVGTSFTVTFTEAAGPVTIVDTDATITDPENDAIVSLTASLGLPLDTGAEFLTATVGSGITALYTPATGVLTLSGNRPIADYQAALRTLRYVNTSTNPNTTQRAVQVVVQDAPGANSDAAVAQINVVPINDPPVIDLNGPLVAGINHATTFTEDAGNQTLVATDFTITDPDSPLLQGARVILQNRPDGALESLSATAIAPVTVQAYNATNGQLDLVGPATPAEFRQVLATVVYTNTSNTPNTANRNIDFYIADDLGAVNNPVARTVLTVVATNDSPVLDLNGNGAGLNATATYTEGAAAIAIVGTTGLPGLTITDVDSANIVSATVRITNLLDGADEQLSATSGGQFTVGYNQSTGVLLITANPAGGVSLINFQTRLRTVVYQNTSQAPNTTPRAITFVVQDSGGAMNAPVTSTVTVVGVNDPPTMTGFTVPAGILEDASATDISSAITVGDVDAHAGTGLLRLTLGVTWGALAASGDVTVAGNGTTSIVMTGTVVNLNAATVTFTPTPNQNGANQLTATVNDLGNYPGLAQSFSPTAAAFTVVAQNDEPHLITNTGLDQTQALSPTLPITYNITSATLQFGDIDGDPANQIIYTVQALPTNGALMLGSTALVACAGPGTSSFTQADIDNGLLRYRMTTYTAAFVTSFGFATGNAANCGGAANSYTISVHP